MSAEGCTSLHLSPNAYLQRNILQNYCYVNILQILKAVRKLLTWWFLGALDRQSKTRQLTGEHLMKLMKYYLH